MKVIETEREFVIFTIDGHWGMAKVYDLPSEFGINKGRVSKLSIVKGEKWDASKEVYSYERGLDFDNSPKGLLDKILKQLEKKGPIT